MEDPKSAAVMILDNEIVQVTAFNKTFLVTRSDFAKLETRSRMLEQIVFRGGGLSTIRHVFDEPTTDDDEVAKRFQAWHEAQADGSESVSTAGVVNEW